MAKEKIGDHPFWGQLAGMEIGEEFKDDVWSVVRIPGGYIVNRLNWGTVYVPEAN